MNINNIGSNNYNRIMTDRGDDKKVSGDGANEKNEMMDAMVKMQMRIFLNNMYDTDCAYSVKNNSDFL